MSLLRADKLANQANNGGPVIVGPSTVSGDFIVTQTATVLGLAVTNSVMVGSAVTSRHITASNTANLFQTVLTGITTAGIITQATYYGDGVNLSGVVTSIKAGNNITVNNSSGEVTISSSGSMIADDITADTLVVTGISTLGIVTGATYYGDGSNLTGVANTANVISNTLVVSGVSTLGVVTGATYYGDGSNLTGVVGGGGTANVRSDTLVVTGVSTLGVVTGATYYGDGSNLTGVANTANVISNTLVVSGVATFLSDVSIAGTMTFEDVNNLDVVGMVTARNGIQILDGGLTVVGVTTLQTVEAGAYIGDGVNLTGIVTSIIAGNNITISPVNGKGEVTIGASGSMIADDITADTLVVTGISTLGIVTGVTAIEATTYYGDGSNLTGITHTQVGAMGSLVDDTTPQLGGNLDINGKYITGTGGVDITGVVTATSFAGSGANLTGVMGSLVDDTTPQLGGDLDLNAKYITGTGGVDITGVVTATSFAGSGANLTGVMGDLVDDTTPQLGGNLDLNSNNIDGSGYIDINGGIDVTGVVTATSFAGSGTNLTGVNASTAVTATNAENIEVNANSNSVFRNIVFVNGTDGNLKPQVNTSIQAQPSTGTISADFYEGSGVKLTGIVTSIIAGNNITISPVNGKGQVTINSSGGGGGGGNNLSINTLVVSGFSTLGGASFSDSVTGTTFIGDLSGTATNCSRSVVAGDGLTGGGALSDNRTINVGAGSGISVGDDAIAVDTTVVRTSGAQSIHGTKTFGSTISGSIDGNANTATTAVSATNSTNCSRSVVAGDGLTGGGTLSANVTLNVGAGSGISVAADSVAVDSTVVRTTGNQTIAGTKTFSSTISGDIDGNANTATTATTAGSATNSTNVNLRSRNTTDATHYVTFGTAISGNQRINTDSDLTYNPSSNTLTVGAVVGNLTGNVTGNVSGSAGSATNSTNCSRQVIAGNGLTGGGTLNANRTLNVGAGSGISVAADSVAVDSTVVRTTGNQTIAGTKTFSSTISGSINGSAASANTATTATNANNIEIDINNADATRYLVFVNGTDGNLPPLVNTTIQVNPNRGRITATAFQGDGSLLTNIPAGQLTGTVNDARLPGTITSNITGNAATVSVTSITSGATERPVYFNDGTTTSGNGVLRIDGSANGMRYRADQNRLILSNLTVVNAVSGNLNGNATTASTATLASTVTVSSTSVNLNHRVALTEGTGSKALLSDGQLLYNPSTNVLTSGTFSGSGASLTNIPAGQLTGTINDARLPGTITSNITGSSASCTGNSATATTAASCSGNSATATTAASCSGNSATATLASTVTVTGTNSNINYRVALTDGTGSKNILSDGGLLYNASSNIITASGGFSGPGGSLTGLNASNITSGTINDARLPGTISSNITGSSASCTGNSATATSATSATNATNLNIRSRNTTNATHYVTFATSTSGNQRLNSDTGLTYNPSSNTLTTGTVVANLSGNATTSSSCSGNSATATVANGLNTSASGANSQRPVVVVNGTSPQTSSAGVTINVGTGRLFAVSFTGNGSNITNLNASQIASGTINDARLPGTITSNITGNAATASSVQCDISTDQSVNVLFCGSATSSQQTPRLSTLITGNLNSGRINVAQFKVSDLGGTGTRAVYSTNNGILTNSSSDQTLKTNVASLATQYNVVKQLNPVTFNWINTDYYGTQQEVGFIAQQMQTHVPQVVGTNNDGTLTIDYAKLTSVLTKALQESIAKIESLEARLDAAGL